ncbi:MULTISPECIES: immunity 22 family protein [Janthinobacterium]|uniref:Immunity 22 family protein n=1 Tax=Janthinobacterium kumbetense TaxID=2950280 RepID=A0ABT0WLI6_9BURK|nr:immunity 22 family protein [Janthinobacterium sp. 13]MCM2564584.1 immunity 22 family protein [Janthinobacterium kumbetense]PIF13142.1 immunity protein 22 of polymorphic toxin system [Janthinobacterium sp. 13]
MSDSAPIVHVFACNGRFPSWEALQAYLSPTYTEDGDAVPSPFFLETGLTSYEPACFESAMLASAAPLAQLLDGASYGDSWLAQACADAQAQGVLADASVCVFAPNQLAHPQRSSLHYVGSYRYCVED